MKKIILALALLVLAAPAWATVTITATDEGGGSGVVRIDWSGPDEVRAFALDITVSDGNILTVTPIDANYWVFPGSIDINTITGLVDDVGRPIGDPCDHSDTRRGLDSNGVTIEMASLYEVNAPGLSGALLSVEVSTDCNLTVTANAIRGGVVLADTNAAATNLPITIPVSVICTVPNVLAMNETNATAAITGAGFTLGTVTTAWDDGEAAGEVLTQAPAGGAEPGCSTAVDLTVSLGPCVVPSVVGDFNNAAQTAITDAGFTVGTITFDCNDSLKIADGNVISTNPAAGATPGCGTAVDIVVADYTASDVAMWDAMGRPACWCASINPRQCHGDADGTGEGFPIANKYVLTKDLTVFIAAWNKTDVQLGLPNDPCTVDVGGGRLVELICADSEHTAEGFPIANKRVLSKDLAIFIAFWNQAGLPDPNCP